MIFRIPMKGFDIIYFQCSMAGVKLSGIKITRFIHRCHRLTYWHIFVAAQFYRCQGQRTCNYHCSIKQVSHEDGGREQQKCWEDWRDHRHLRGWGGNKRSKSERTRKKRAELRIQRTPYDMMTSHDVALMGGPILYSWSLVVSPLRYTSMLQNWTAINSMALSETTPDSNKFTGNNQVEVHI